MQRFSECFSVPVAVSIVEDECDKATNILSVIYEPLEEGEERKDVAVCVKV